MSALRRPSPLLLAEEYLRRERAAETRSEYVNGERPVRPWVNGWSEWLEYDPSARPDERNLTQAKRRDLWSRVPGDPVQSDRRIYCPDPEVPCRYFGWARDPFGAPVLP